VCLEGYTFNSQSTGKIRWQNWGNHKNETPVFFPEFTTPSGVVLPEILPRIVAVFIRKKLKDIGLIFVKIIECFRLRIEN